MLSFIAILLITIGALGLLMLSSIGGFVQVLIFIFSFVLLIRFMEIAKR